MRKYYSPLIGAALAAASLFQFSLPAFAIGTSAGTPLRNSATATYDDQNNNRYNVTSNEVTVTVGKIAGITNVPSGFSDNSTSTTNTSILPGDSVSFDFEVTNTGNDATDIFIPEASNITVENLIDLVVEYSTDDGVSFTARPANGIVANVDENASIIVRVTGKVSATATQGDNISVQLGDTGSNTADLNSTDFAGTQNQPDINSTVANDVQLRDVRTQTANNANTDVDGDPVNGQREASAKQIVPIGSQPLALPRIEKVNAGVDDGGTPADLSDNVITYNLNLEVAGNSDPQVAAYPDFPFNAADLEGRDYSSGTAGAGTPATFNIAGLAQADQTNLILVSDAIPENTNLSANISPFGNWIPVYTNSLLTTPADNAEWTSVAPTTQTARDSVTRVGWVYDARTSTNGVIPAGSNVTGFSFNVVTTGITTNTATAIYNIAQIFGSTDDNADGAGGLITYDESGDQNPANLTDDGNFGLDETATTTVDGNDLFGYADPGTNENNVDPNGNNTGTGEAGEVNKIIVAPNAVTSDIFNGPENSANAVGDIFDVTPADDNHDFQNLAATDLNTATTATNAEGYEITTYDPAAVNFINTVSNPSDRAISNVVLDPVSPEQLGLSGEAADLPDGTVVTIIYGAQSATYTFNRPNPTDPGAFTINSGTGTGTDGRVVIPSIARNSTANYTVSVNLPDATALSTNFVGGDPDNEVVGGYPVPVVAYLDDNGTNGLQADDTYNVTVNQVYLGYLQLVKEARVLRNNGTRLVEIAGFNADDSTKQPAPGDILEYRITYTNISDVESTSDGTSSGNVVLYADDLVITEDGVLGDNNWAEDNDDPAEDGDTLIDTLHVLDGAKDSTTGSTIRYFNATGTGNASQAGFSSEVTDFGITDDITKYEVSGITRLTPGKSGNFTFQRKITSQEDIDDLNPTP
jgi:hypothetical protein